VFYINCFILTLKKLLKLFDQIYFIIFSKFLININFSKKFDFHCEKNHGFFDSINKSQQKYRVKGFFNWLVK